MKSRAAPTARRSGGLLRTLRIALLLYILLMVAATAWLTKARSTDWDDTLYMAIYPVNGDKSESTQRYVAELEAPAFAPVAAFFAREGARYGLALENPIEVDLGKEIAEAPPVPPSGGNPISIGWWSLRLRWFAWRTEHAQSLPSPDIRMFVVYYDPQTHQRLAHSLGLSKGLIGVVNAFAARDYDERNDVVVAHELLHTLGATDKYDPATNAPIYPEGYAEPDAKPLHPQRNAEIMAGRIARSESRSEIPESMKRVVIGPKTAREINWVK